MAGLQRLDKTTDEIFNAFIKIGKVALDDRRLYERIYTLKIDYV